ncbi:MAG: SDR family oxidoreductase [Saprospiraceae bacterium]
MRAVITGATKGIGRAIVEAFAKAGYDLAICARTQADLDTLQTELKTTYPNINLIMEAVDMSKKEAVKDFAVTIVSQWKQVDILINNAGVFKPGAVSEEEEGTLEFQIETNLYSAYYMTRGLLPAMLPHESGHIFNMCSIASFMAYPNGGSYSVSKFAMLGFSKALREEMKTKGIKVTSIMPGATWSASWDGAPFPEDRLMKAEDIAHSVLSVAQMNKGAVVEEMVIRPQLGDL